MQQKSNTEQFTPKRRVIKKKKLGPSLGPRAQALGPGPLGLSVHMTIAVNFQNDKSVEPRSFAPDYATEIQHRTVRPKKKSDFKKRPWALGPSLGPRA